MDLRKSSVEQMAPGEFRTGWGRGYQKTRFDGRRERYMATYLEQSALGDQQQHQSADVWSEVERGL